MKKKLRYLLFCILLPMQLTAYMPLYFCTAADERHFGLLKSFIGSIHKTNFDHLGEIAVFDLGFTPEQRAQLERMQKVCVCDLELRHPDILKHFQVFPDGKKARGWYAWKPVAIKQALDKYPYVLWQDAGNVILKPLDNLFEHIRQHGYFLIGYKHKVRDFTPCTLAQRFGLYEPHNQWILDAYQLEAGAAQGFCRSNQLIYEQYLMPMYTMAADLHTYFADDGSAPRGFGASRHDQTLFSIMARLLNLEVGVTNHYPTKIFLTINGEKIPFYADWENATDKTDIFYASRGRLVMEEYIRYLPTPTPPQTS